MKKSRRKFIGITLGTIMSSGLAGCMDNENNNGNDNNNTTESNPKNVDNDNNKNNEENGTGQEIGGINTYIKDSVSEIRCTNSADNVKNIGLNNNGNYNFSGTKKLQSSCYSIDIDSDIVGQKLVVDVSLFKSEENCSECVSGSEPQLSYSGVVFVEDNSNIEESEVNIVIN